MSASIPLSIPDDLLKRVRAVAKEAHLSQQDVIRQSVRLGLPKLREQIAPERVTNVASLPKKVLARIYSRPERDEPGIQRLIGRQPKGVRD